MSVNVISEFYRTADRQPGAVAMALPVKSGNVFSSARKAKYEQISFGELASETRLIASGLRAFGFEPGDRVVLMVPPGKEFFTLVYACLHTGIIPVLIDPAIGTRNLKKCIQETKPVGFIGVPRAHAARIFLGWGKPTVRKLVTVGAGLFRQGHTLEDIRVAGKQARDCALFEARPDDMASIAFTSGSTGISKGVVNTFGNLAAQVAMLRDKFPILPGDVDLPTFAPFALLNPLLGVTSVLPDMDTSRPVKMDPRRIIEAIRAFGVTSMFGSPVVLDRIAQYAQEHGIRLPTLKRVFSAGAPVPVKVLESLSVLLSPDAEIYTPYGATECMPVSSIDARMLLQEHIRERTESGGGICIGKPFDSLEVRIIRITDDPIDKWHEGLVLENHAIGEIVVQGPNVTPSYYNREEATQYAKIRDGSVFWHRMGDVGYFDQKGNLWFCGRKSHRVRVGDSALFSLSCEPVFNRHPLVYRSALVGVSGKPVLCVQTEPGVTSRQYGQIEAELLEIASKNEVTRLIRNILFHPAFPVDIRHNAKIIREELALWASSKL